MWPYWSLKRLEVVDVDHHQAQRLVAVLRARHLALEHRAHPVAIAESRQRVRVRVALGLAQHAEAARDEFVVGAHALRQHDEQVLAERVRAVDHAPQQVWLMTMRCEGSTATTNADGSLSSINDISPAHEPGPRSAIFGASSEPRCTARRPLSTT